MKSMTGYGGGSASHQGSSVTIELKAVNGKQRDIRCALPACLAATEAALVALLSETIVRGSVSVAVAFQPSPEQKMSSLRIDEELAAAAVDALRRIATQSRMETTVTVGDLLALPGVVSVESAALPMAMATELVLSAAAKALSTFDRARLAEGEHLRADLTGLQRELDALLVAMANRQDEALVHHRDRLLERIRLLDVQVKLDDERLAKEVAFTAQRSDIAEELIRLRAHVEGFKALVQKNGSPVGRELQFVCQEIHREINTLCSKSSETAIAREGIQFKTVLEKVREQIANVE